MYHNCRRLYDLLHTGFSYLSCTPTALGAHADRAVPRGSDIFVVRSRPHGRNLRTAPAHGGGLLTRRHWVCGKYLGGSQGGAAVLTTPVDGEVLRGILRC